MRKIKSTGYKIYIGEDVFEAINKLTKERYKKSEIFILVDENTLSKCLPLLVSEVPRFANANILEIESGEENKNIEICAQLWHSLSDYNADRETLFINLGGGVIGDMGGFVASAYKRGIDFINIPTTLLSQVDASVGGKTGIDHGIFKNQIGFFNNPKAVFIYPGFLRTLDSKQLLSGFAEIIKHALIADKNYWKALINFTLNEDFSWSEVIAHSVKIKNGIVLRDEHEKGVRKILNFGHTIGHAFESYFLEKNNPVLHGEAIAAGMICEAHLSFQKELIKENELGSISEYIRSKYVPLKFNVDAFSHLIELMGNDKKNKNGKINFSLLQGIGAAIFDQQCKDADIKKSFEYYLHSNELH